MFLERVQIQDINLLVWSVTEQKLVPAVLNVELSDSQTHMLGHLMDEFHLNHSTDFITFIAQDKFSDLLVTHVGRSVNLGAQILDFSNALRLVGLNLSFPDESEICAYVLEDTKARASWCTVTGDDVVRII